MSLDHEFELEGLNDLDTDENERSRTGRSWRWPFPRSASRQIHLVPYTEGGNPLPTLRLRLFKMSRKPL